MLSINLLERMAQVMKVLAHPHRLKMIERLREKKARPVHTRVS